LEGAATFHFPDSPTGERRREREATGERGDGREATGERGDERESKKK